MIRHSKKEILFHIHLMKVRFRFLRLLVTREVTSRVGRIFQH